MYCHISSVPGFNSSYIGVVSGGLESRGWVGTGNSVRIDGLEGRSAKV